MDITFNQDVLAGKWKQVRGKVKQAWGKLTDQLINATADAVALIS